MSISIDAFLRQPTPSKPTSLRAYQLRQAVPAPARHSTLLQEYTDNPRATLQASRPKVTVAVKQEGAAELTLHRSSTPLKRQLSTNTSAMSDLSTQLSTSFRSLSAPRPSLGSLLTAQYRSAYPPSNFIAQRQPRMTRTLRTTAVTPHFRARMVNWMMEVFHKFGRRCSDRTLFRAVLIMDLFFRHYRDRQLVDRQLTNDDVYLVGLTCIFVASKYTDTDYITLEELGAIKHTKGLPVARILEFEVTILLSLNFEISFPTLLEFLEQFWERVLEGQSADFAQTVRALSLQTAKACLLNVELNELTLEVLGLSVVLFVLRHVDCSASIGGQSLHHNQTRVFQAALEAQRRVVTLAGPRQAAVDTGTVLVRQHIEDCPRAFPGLDNPWRLAPQHPMRLLS